MTQQPTLTDFPPTIFANSKRRLQASLRAAREQVIRQSICGYSLLFADALPPQLLEAHDPTCRQRHYGHIPVFWAWLSQILEANAFCSKALGLIQAGSTTLLSRCIRDYIVAKMLEVIKKPQS